MRDDQGVFDKTTGKWMARVAATPRPGAYVFDSERDVYTFAPEDDPHDRYIVGRDPCPWDETIADAGRSIRIEFDAPPEAIEEFKALLDKHGVPFRIEKK